MQFADYVVGYALQANTDCLQRLASLPEEPAVGNSGAPSPGTLPAKDARRLRRNSERLLSLWQMMHWSVGKAPYRRGVARLEEVQRLLPVGNRWVDRAAQQLLTKADGAKSAAAVEIMRQGVIDLQGSPLPADLDRLSCLFQAESECWRDYALLRKVQDYDLIEHGIGRAYGKARRLGERLAAQPHNPRRLQRTHRWVRHNINHLELLRPALSQSNKARAWFLDRLGANLEKQINLLRFCAQGRALKLKPKVAARIERLADNRCRRLAGQTSKLLAGAFQDSDEAFIRAVASDVKKLGLQEITLLPAERPRQESIEG
jgi:hypothetical protein